MQSLFEVVGFVAALWREAVGTLVGIALAFGLHIVFPALQSAVWFLLGFVGAGSGVVWHVGSISAREAKSGRPQPRFTSWASFLGIAAVGGLWGHLVESAAGPLLAVVSLSAMPVPLSPLFGYLSKQRIQRSSVAITVLACLLGFATPHAINLLFQASAA